MRRTQTGPPVAWIWAGVAILAVLLVSVLFWVVTIRPAGGVPANARIVPDVSGMAYERANEALAEEDLVSVRVDRADPEVPSGNVISTDPAAGSSVNPRQEVRVLVSRGRETRAIPTIVGLSQDAAKGALEGAGLVLGAITPRNDADTDAGTVLAADPEAGTEVAEGTVVNLTVATGRVVLPDVTGYTLDAAKRQLESAELGLVVAVAEDPNCQGSVESPTVATQSIAPGEAPIRSTVTLTYCVGA